MSARLEGATNMMATKVLRALRWWHYGVIALLLGLVPGGLAARAAALCGPVQVANSVDMVGLQSSALEGVALAGNGEAWAVGHTESDLTLHWINGRWTRVDR